MGFWIYLHRGEGVWQRIPWARFDRFTDGKDRIKDPPAGAAKFAEAWVDTEERIPVELLRLVFFKMPMRPDGSLDPEREKERTRAQFDAQEDLFLRAEPGSREYADAISRARFARRRAAYLAGWHPSPADRQALQVELARRGLAWDGYSSGRFGPPG